MQTIVTKWGNSLAIRIPSAFAKQLGLNNDSKVDLKIEKDKIILKKSPYNLKDMVNSINEENLHKEINTGPIIGKEIW